jgi:hypothetical protein
MIEIIGNFIEPLPAAECLSLNFSPLSPEIKQRWQQHRLSVDFLADYWSIFSPSPQVNQQVKSAVAYIANELL